MGERDGHTAIEHSGEVSGFVSENLVFPDARAAVIVLTNEMATQAARQIADRITPMVLGTPAPAPTKAEAQALAIFNSLADGHIDRKLFTSLLQRLLQPADDGGLRLQPEAIRAAA